MAENRHIFNNLTNIEKIKPKIDNPIMVEDVQYNFSDMIENEWISHFPQYSYRMRSTFVKGASIVDDHLGKINQCLIDLENELYRVYDKLSEDKKAEVTNYLATRQNEITEFIQARQNEVANFISNRKEEVKNFINDRKAEVSNFIQSKDSVVNTFVKNQTDNIAKYVQAKEKEITQFITTKDNEIAEKKKSVDNFIKQKDKEINDKKQKVEDFIKLKDNEILEKKNKVENFIKTKDNEIATKKEEVNTFISNKDKEVKERTTKLDGYIKNLEDKTEQFNRVIENQEATDDKLGLIKLSTIDEKVVEATTDNLIKKLCGTYVEEKPKNKPKEDEGGHKPPKKKEEPTPPKKEETPQPTPTPPKPSEEDEEEDLEKEIKTNLFGVEVPFELDTTQGVLKETIKAFEDFDKVLNDINKNKALIHPEAELPESKFLGVNLKLKLVKNLDIGYNEKTVTFLDGSTVKTKLKNTESFDDIVVFSWEDNSVDVINTKYNKYIDHVISLYICAILFESSIYIDNNTKTKIQNILGFNINEKTPQTPKFSEILQQDGYKTHYFCILIFTLTLSPLFENINKLKEYKDPDPEQHMELEKFKRKVFNHNAMIKYFKTKLVNKQPLPTITKYGKNVDIFGGNEWCNIVLQ